jgi:hypothetical protein
MLLLVGWNVDFGRVGWNVDFGRVGWNVDFGRWQDWRGRLLARFIRERRVWRGKRGI